jgi:hypothetical protein
VCRWRGAGDGGGVRVTGRGVAGGRRTAGAWRAGGPPERGGRPADRRSVAVGAAHPVSPRHSRSAPRTPVGTVVSKPRGVCGWAAAAGRAVAPVCGGTAAAGQGVASVCDGRLGGRPRGRASPRWCGARLGMDGRRGRRRGAGDRPPGVTVTSGPPGYGGWGRTPRFTSAQPFRTSHTRWNGCFDATRDVRLGGGRRDVRLGG